MEMKKDILWRVYLIYFFVMLGAVTIIFQSIRLQVFQGKSLRAEAQSLSTKYQTIQAERGSVFSEDGSLLATSLPKFEIRFDTRADGLGQEEFQNNIDSLSTKMHETFGKRSAIDYKRWFLEQRDRGNRYLLIGKKLTYPELLELKTWPIFRNGRFKGGFIVNQENRRVNPYNSLAHRTIGYVRENSQSVGLEAFFNEDLKGVSGKRLVQKISGSTWVPINDKEEIEPVNGKDLVTTLDIRLQDIAQTALHRGLVANKADHGSAIVMEVATGKIKAIANLKRLEDETYWEQYNYAIGETTEPGSTFKLASLLALLDDGKISLSDSIDLFNGKTKFYDREMKDSEWHPHRRVTVQKAFELSSNVGISQLISRHYRKDPKVFFRKLDRFGLLDKTEITVKGEPSPIFTKPGETGWSGVSLPWMSIGYGMQLTPLQILAMYNGVANNGKLMKPYLVNSVSEFGKAVEEFAPVTLESKMASEKAIQGVQACLLGAVQNGTAKNLANSSCLIAGKTGTAKISDPQRGYQNVYQASFAGYWPADQPKYSCIVVVNSPSAGKFYGSSVAAPIFQEIAEKTYSNLMEVVQAPVVDSALRINNFRFRRAHNDDIKELANHLGLPFDGSTETNWYSSQGEGVARANVSKSTLPNLKGFGLKDAVYLLENLGYTVEIKGRGKVTKQSIKAGTEVVAGTKIQIQLGI